MGKLQLFELALLNNTNNVYYAGQEVTGIVRLRIGEPMKAREVRVQVEGAANTRWTESRTTTSSNGRGGTTTHHHTDVYSANETYLSIRIPLWPFANQPVTSGNADMYLQPGSYELPFKFVLPIQCPSSFVGSYGNITYFCKAVIDRPWQFDDKFKALFTVIGLVDLNQEPDAVRPIRDMKSKQLGCLCCVSGHLECNVDIERCGYVPGENIPLNFEICNNSSSQVTSVKAKLVENVVYIARHGWSEHSKTGSRVVAQVESTEFVGPGDVQKWFGKFLPIPAVAPTLKTCGIIRSSYQLEIKAVPDGCCTRSLKMFFPILIGNVPLRIVYQHIAPVQPAHIPTAPEAAGWVAPSAPASDLPAYPDLPPPSYEEAIFGGGSAKDETDDEHTGGPTDFAPKYPMYRFLSNNVPTAPVQ